MSYELELDLCGLECPLPILRSKKAIAGLPSGELLHVMATDPGALKDFPAFCRVTGHLLKDSWQDENIFHFVLEKR